MKKETKQGSIATIKHLVIPYATALLGPFLSSHPEWMGIWYSAIGLYGVYMEYNQDKINDLMQTIDENPAIFPKDIVNSEDFKEGFLISLEEFIKARGNKKREIIKRILLGFTSSKDKEKFALERMYDCLDKIGIEHIDLLRFIQNQKFGLKTMSASSKHGMPTYVSQYDDIKYLVSLGILSSKNTIEMEDLNNPLGKVEIFGQNPAKELKQEEWVELSEFGKEFVKFLVND